MKTKMPILLTIIFTGLVTSLSYATEVLSGLDQNNQPCQLVLTRFTPGETTLKDACDFETDGPGPWCDGKPAVAITPVRVTGVFSTVAGNLPFDISDEYSRVSEAERTFSGTSGKSNLNVSITENGGEVYSNLLTDYGRTLTSQQINRILLHVSKNSSYQAEYNRVYVDQRCHLNK